MTFNPKAFRDNDRNAFDDCPSGDPQKTVRRVEIKQSAGVPLNSNIVDSDGDEIDITQCGELRITESSHKSGITRLRTFSGEIVVNATGVNLVDRKTILIQPITNDLFIGFEANETWHLVTKENFFEVRAEDNVNVYMRRTNNGNIDVAVSEIK